MDATEKQRLLSWMHRRSRDRFLDAKDAAACAYDPAHPRTSLVPALSPPPPALSPPPPAYIARPRTPGPACAFPPAAPALRRAVLPAGTTTLRAASARRSVSDSMLHLARARHASSRARVYARDGGPAVRIPSWVPYDAEVPRAPGLPYPGSNRF